MKPWIDVVEYDDAEGRLKSLYDKVKGPDNNVDNIMMAHSLPGEVFGPAQGLHGATYVVDVAFYCETLITS